MMSPNIYITVVAFYGLVCFVLRRDFRVLKKARYAEVMEMLAQAIGCRVDQIRIWPFSQRTNQTCRPTAIELEDPNKTVRLLLSPCESCQLSSLPWRLSWKFFLTVLLSYFKAKSFERPKTQKKNNQNAHNLEIPRPHTLLCYLTGQIKKRENLILHS